MPAPRRSLIAFPVLLLSAAAAHAQLPGAAPADLPHDLSFTNMVANADWVVKGVIGLLTLASVLTWTVAVAKTVEFVLHSRATSAGLRTLGAAATLDEAARRMPGGACARLVEAARAELETSGPIGTEGIKERAAWKLDRLVAATGRGLGRGTGLLATVGSVAPFVGLFGTVWGIMNSFIGISKSQTTNLAVVAPGIAEALLATAIGLVAAIPAVVIYNAFARATAGAKARLADGVAETMRLLSRDLDRAAARPVPRLHAAE